MTSFVQALFSRPVGRTPRGLTSFLGFAVLSMVCAPALAATATDLGSNDPFAIVSETYSNSTAATSINGDVCYTTGPAANPTISGVTEVPCDDQRGIDQNTALADLNAQNCEPLGAAVALDTVSINGGTPGEFPPGCYSSTGAMSITTGGTVSLTGSGVYIFRPDGALDAGADSEVVMTAAGACENDVYWTPTGGTTVGANSAFVGNIFRGTADGLSVTLGDSASLTGRILAFGSTVTTDNNTITVPTCQGIPPAITLTKTITGGDPYSTEGDTITYSLVAENTGSVTLTDVTISDPDVILSNCVPAQGATLDPAETISCDGSYTVSQADVDAGSFLNIATVVGTDPQSETVNNTDSAMATVTSMPTVDIALTKTITSGNPYSAEGDTITYSLVAENTGGETLTDVTISDPDVTLSNCTPTQGSTLNSGGTLSCEGSYSVIQADVDAGSFTNIAMVVGIGPNSETVEDTDSATATVMAAPVSVFALSGWAMITLAMFLAIFGLTVVFRQQG